MGCPSRTPNQFQQCVFKVCGLNVYAKLRTAALGKSTIAPHRGMLGVVYLNSAVLSNAPECCYQQ